MTVPRVLSPVTNPTGLLASAGIIYAAAVMIVNAVNGHGVIDPSVIIAAIAAVGALLARQVVTPVADPRNGAGTPLAPVSTLPPGVYSSGGASGIVQMAPAGQQEEPGTPTVPVESAAIQARSVELTGVQRGPVEPGKYVTLIDPAATTGTPS